MDPFPHKAPDDDNVYEGRDLEVMTNLPNYTDWIVSFFKPWIRGETLEVGAGVGTISTRLRESAERMELLEPATNLLPHLRARFADDPAVTIHEGTLESWGPDAPDSAFDTIAMVSVLEHIRDDDAAMHTTARLLRPGGHALLFVPAMPFLYSELDRKVGHFRRYRRDPLWKVVEGAGFRILCGGYFDLFGIPAWGAVHTLGGRESFHLGGARLFDRFIVPIVRRAESLLPPPVGKNLILVAEKPGGQP